LQAELKAIQAGLQYGELRLNDGIYTGYVENGQAEGVGITTYPGKKDIAEYHLNILHGCVKTEYADKNSYWGEYNDGKREGYGTFEWANGEKYMGQWINGCMHGYGIYRWPDARVHYG
jgi:hypothetical protein